MATTLTAPASTSGDLVHLSFPIIKFEKVDPGNPNSDLMVYGKATDGSVDSDEQIVDEKFSGKAIADWLSSGGNVRVQHNSQRDPAGVGIEANTDNEGATWVKSLVVEPTAKILVEKGALRAYSVGIARPKIVRDSVARGGRIVDGQIVEISLVDRPANKNCGIQLVKAMTVGDAPQWVGKVWDDREDDNEMVNVDVPKNASISFSPADLAKLTMLKKNLEADAEKRDFDRGVGEHGTDRDAMPTADFAGPDRSFPIKSPGDVPDAWGLAGHADNPDAVRARIRSIAHRKGPSFVAALPDSASTDAKKSQDVPDDVDDEKDTSDEKLSDQAAQKGKGKKPFPGAAKPFDGQDDDGDGQDADKPDPAEKSHGGDCDCDKCMSSKAAEPDDDDPDDDDSDDDAQAKPDATKGAKKCTNCGKNFHADSKLKRCSGCNAKLPKATKSVELNLDLSGSRMVSDADLEKMVVQIGRRLALNDVRKAAGVKVEEPEAEKKAKVMCKGCGANIHQKHGFCPECGKSTATAVKKNHDFTCLKCGNDLDKGEKFCGGCGKKNPGFNAGADAKIGANKAEKGDSVNKTNEPATEKGKPTPGADGGGSAAAAALPVPDHREPDGTYIEDFEHDAGLPTDADGPYEMKAAKRIKATGAPHQLGALHDLTCPGFHPTHAAKSHPTALADLDLSYWQDLAEGAIYGGTFEQARKSAALLRAAESLKAMGPGGYFGAALEAHKSFQMANPGTGSFPSPTVITPGQFKRPVITDGHSKPGADYNAPNAPGTVPSGQISASGFDRGYLAAGHGAASPSNKSVGEAMALVHDHLAALYPALCPMGTEVAKAVEEPAVKTEAVAATEAAKPEATKGKKNKAKKSGGKKMPPPQQATDQDDDDDAGAASDDDSSADKSVATDEVVNKAATVDADMIKSAMLEVTGGLLEKLTSIEKALEAEKKKSKKLAEQVDQMADMPDPRVFAYRSAGMASPLVQKGANPAGWTPVAETAERTQAALLNVLADNARNSTDSSVREAAWDEIYRMNGIGGQ